MQLSTAAEVEGSGMKLFPDETLDAALRLLAIQPRIQVVSRLHADLVLGTLTLDDVQRAYGVSVRQEAEF
jgi:hypothetical protein